MAVPSSGSLEAFWGRLKHSPVLNTRRRMFHKPANMSDTKTDMDGEGIPNKPASGKLFLFFFPPSTSGSRNESPSFYLIPLNKP